MDMFRAELSDNYGYFVKEFKQISENMEKSQIYNNSEHSALK